MIVETRKEKKEENYNINKEKILSSVPPEGIIFIKLIEKVVKQLNVKDECEREKEKAFIDESITFFVKKGYLDWGADLKIYKSANKRYPFFCMRGGPRTKIYKRLNRLLKSLKQRKAIILE